MFAGYAKLPSKPLIVVVCACGLLLCCFFEGNAYAEVYLSKEQALDLVLGKDTEHIYLPKKLTSEVLEKLRKGHLLPAGFSSASYRKAHFFMARKGDKTTGYALIDAEIGKHLPITYIVGISTKGIATQVEIMVFREVRGWEVKDHRFLSQFNGMRTAQGVKDIKNITGATLSSRAVTKGVKRAILLWKNYFDKPNVLRDQDQHRG